MSGLLGLSVAIGVVAALWGAMFWLTADPATRAGGGDRPTGRRRSIAGMIEFTEWATDILRRSHEAARRFNANATLRMARASDGRVTFELTDERRAGDLLLEGDGFDLLAQEGLDGVVDVVEPHDQLILRPPDSTERSVRDAH